MTRDEIDRLGIVEAKVDRVIALLDDPDFGIRTTLKTHDTRIRAVELKVYTALSAIAGAALLWAGVLAKSVGG